MSLGMLEFGDMDENGLDGYAGMYIRLLRNDQGGLALGCRGQGIEKAARWSHCLGGRCGQTVAIPDGLER